MRMRCLLFVYVYGLSLAHLIISQLGSEVYIWGQPGSNGLHQLLVMDWYREGF